MAKNKEKTGFLEVENSIENEIIETIEEVQPIAQKHESSLKLKVGFVAITHKIKGGEIAINEKQYGTLFKEDEWTIITQSKKK